MRYYRLFLTKDGKPLSTRVGNTQVNIGPFDTTKTPGYGQHIEFDILIQSYDVVSSGLIMAIFGLPVEFLKQNVKLIGYTFKLEAGFQAGLPLANPNQRGVVMQGTVYSSYSNYLGTNQCLLLNCTPQLFDNALTSPPVNPIGFDGKQGDKLSDVILKSLMTAYPADKYPGITIVINISDNLILTEDMPGIYERGLQSFALFLRSLSRGLYQNKDYAGVSITLQANRIIVFDNAAPAQMPVAITINLAEFIGQPDWLTVNTITFKCPMRADIKVSDYVHLSQDPFSESGSIFFGSSSQIFNSARNTLSFSGYFQIKSVRHIGQYLNPDANSAWVTIYEANVIAGGDS